jgi:integrase
VKKHKPNTINLNLAKIKAFLNWCRHKGYILETIEVKMVHVDEKPVQYLSDSDLAEIMKCDVIENHYKRAFMFYLETGCRKTEPFKATLSGRWLIIEPDIAKSHRTREVHLSPILLSILNEMLNHLDDRIRKYGYQPQNIIDRYSKEFKKSCRAIGLDKHHLHNLRDTYAVRRWAVTGDIHLVSKEIGHASVMQTEKYANFNLRRLLGDFPTLSEYIKVRLEKHNQEDYFLELLNEEVSK